MKRRDWMSLLARAPAERVERLWQAVGQAPEHTVLRPAETGTAMVRGRAGATGAPFNLGEITVTRCSVQLADGTVGHGYVQGRAKAHAVAAALIDAGMQGPDAAVLERAVLAPLREQQEARRHARAARAAATKVDFFTLARGED
ncbi:phosphonate C-P lyase system protein PhnG [Roseovarius aquimarinus]|uniref:Phosphonate C-P lyase system protein PhnG n=1 Tax=Roseovarius aquimarinus TaxID=1229156 RepID=A0ABW7I5Q5_9RHOB